jgi:eukaryotic-like serine/threonine-protein kinase
MYHTRVGQCLSENVMQELVGGGLSGDALVRVHEHLERCSVCHTVVAELAGDNDTQVQRARQGAVVEPAGDSDTHVAGTPTGGDLDRAPPSLAERFQIIRPLGRGGMGMVYEALHRDRGARIALKTLQHASADGLLRFKNEFRAVQDVQHPNLVTLGELIEDRGQWWLTMELVDGVEFLAHVRPGGTLDETRLRAALVQLSSALQALHARGLVHRDVKPSNVLVAPAGRVVLLDFGLVVHVDQSESNVVGTPAYMAPEQGMAQEIGPPADWYGMGALLYEALTGTPPFDGPPLQVLRAKQQGTPRPPRELASVPEDLDTLCMELLAVDPAARPGVEAVLARLAPGAISTAPAAAALPLFVGRGHELDVLADAFGSIRAGKGAIVLIQGESGIGKSALVRHFCDELRGREPGAAVLAGKCYERETVPYKAFDGVVDALTRHLRKLSPSDTAAVLPRRAGLLVQAFPVLAKIPALRALPADDALDPRELRVRAFSALRELLGRLADRGPLVLCIDDLQWADADSLELLGHVMTPPEAPPLLLIMTTRPRRAEASDANVEAGMARLRELANLHLLELERLSRDEAVRLVEYLLAEAPVQGASTESVANEAEGHPLFIEALVRFAALDPAARPGMRLADVLWARVSALDEPARQLLFLVAVAGWPLSPEIVATMGALPAGELEGAIARLRQAHLVRLADGTGKGALEPYHDRVREAVLDHLDAETRKRCHRALAHALLDMGAVDRGHEADPSRGEAAARDTPKPPSASNASWEAEAIAAHLHGAGELGQAAYYMAVAGDRAAAAFAFDHAARLYRLALELHAQAGEPLDVFGPGGARDVLMRLARTLAHASRGAEAAAVYLQLARMAEADGEEDIQLRLLAAEQFLRSGHVQEGQRVLHPVLAQLGMGRATTRLGLLWRFLWRRAWLRVRGFGYRERKGAEMTARELLRIDACRAAWTTAEEVIPDYMARYQLMALRAGEPVRVGVALFFESFYAYVRGAAAAPRTARIIEQLTVVAERTEEPYLLGLASTARGLIEFAQGNWLHSREHGAQALRIFRERCPEAAHESNQARIGYFGSIVPHGRSSRPRARAAAGGPRCRGAPGSLHPGHPPYQPRAPPVAHRGPARDGEAADPRRHGSMDGEPARHRALVCAVLRHADRPLPRRWRARLPSHRPEHAPGPAPAGRSRLVVRRSRPGRAGRVPIRRIRSPEACSRGCP